MRMFAKLPCGRPAHVSLLIVLAAAFIPSALGQVLNQHDEPKAQDMPQATVAQEIRGVVKVTIGADKMRGFLAPRALGMMSSPGDNQLPDPLIPQILQSSGVPTLRYPGGSYADNYHWSTYKPTKFQASDQSGNYAPNNDFGHLAHLLDQIC